MIPAQHEKYPYTNKFILQPLHPPWPVVVVVLRRYDHFSFVPEYALALVEHSPRRRDLLGVQVLTRRVVVLYVR